jgi:hypothetical protein
MNFTTGSSGFLGGLTNGGIYWSIKNNLKNANEKVYS